MILLIYNAKQGIKRKRGWTSSSKSRARSETKRDVVEAGMSLDI